MLCNQPECDRPVTAKGLCHKHYRRARRHGSPEVVLVKGRAAKPVAERLERGSRREGDCLLWTGAQNEDGYGILIVGSRTDGTRRVVLAHRAAYEVANGPIPEGIHVLHRCDTPPCIEPAHLFGGTQAVNNADMKAKGRARNRYTKDRT